MKNLILLSLMLMVMACGKDDDSEEAGFSLASIEGTWKTECDEFSDGEWAILASTFKDDKRNYHVDYYSNDKCEDVTRTWESEMTIDYQGNSEVVTDGRNMKLEIENNYMTLKTDEIVEEFNSYEGEDIVCEKTDWKKDEKVDLMEICDIPNVGYTTYVVKDNNLYSAISSDQNDGSSEKKRMVIIDSEVPFEKQ